ncbi:hypothetical protein PQQ88_22835 [Paraburkholderia caledonica]|jgi:hypothetical protein|uniref:hypothetical protein n=1 Tax=Paraburkholderia caledonica TaxID=134536 RepID=UPI0013753491|nr:hypothetical protein [Paraburkholderia caledonica]
MVGHLLRARRPMYVMNRARKSRGEARVSAFIDILQTPRAVTGRQRIVRGLDSR